MSEGGSDRRVIIIGQTSGIVARRCGAKTRGGGQCRRWSKHPSGRCPMHGPGYASRVAKGLRKDPATAALKHGRYAATDRARREARLRELVDQPSPDSLHWELALLRLELEDLTEAPVSRDDREHMLRLVEVIRRLVETGVRTRATARIIRGVSEQDLVAFLREVFEFVRKAAGESIGYELADYIRQRAKALVGGETRDIAGAGLGFDTSDCESASCEEGRAGTEDSPEAAAEPED